ESVPYYLYCLRLRRLVLIFVNPLYRLKTAWACGRHHCLKTPERRNRNVPPNARGGNKPARMQKRETLPRKV
ncbi:hypothetical protein, partial [Neisseria meningitidis]|uniref:hypothetical protein n=1 Tax=Neisseria meningitidis TaxID=487 RepID=UPI0011C19EDF